MYSTKRTIQSADTFLENILWISSVGYMLELDLMLLDSKSASQIGRCAQNQPVFNDKRSATLSTRPEGLILETWITHETYRLLYATPKQSLRALMFEGSLNKYLLRYIVPEALWKALEFAPIKSLYSIELNNSRENTLWNSNYPLTFYSSETT